MSRKVWLELRDRLAIEPSIDAVSPVPATALDAFEKSRGLRLPASYRSYCEVFGAGQLGNLFSIAVPGYRGEAPTFQLEYLDNSAHDGQEYEVYSKDPAQHARGLFFCLDLVGSFYFFDPDEVTNARRHEYAVYTVFRDYKLKRVADDFEDFVRECCLGRRRPQLIKGVATAHRFLPVTICFARLIYVPQARRTSRCTGRR